MKSFIVAALLGLAAVTSLGAPANADTFTVHGVFGTNYGN